MHRTAEGTRQLMKIEFRQDVDRYVDDVLDNIERAARLYKYSIDPIKIDRVANLDEYGLDNFRNAVAKSLIDLGYDVYIEDDEINVSWEVKQDAE